MDKRLLESLNVERQTIGQLLAAQSAVAPPQVEVTDEEGADVGQSYWDCAMAETLSAAAFARRLPAPSYDSDP